MSSYKIVELKVSWNQQLQEMYGGGTNVEGGGRLTVRPQRRVEIRRAGRKPVGCGKLPGVVTTRPQSGTCTPTMSPALSRCVSDSGGRFWWLWRLLICMPMAMPPNTRARLGIRGVLPVLFAWRKLAGPREIRNPSWVGWREFGQPERRRAG